ncbi:MAG: hypothetical protein RIC55_35520 [Pirellulaceae bacterium]
MSMLKRLWPRRRRPREVVDPARLLERAEPVSRQFGFDRGQPIDRYYIEAFLHQHRSDVAGRVLEIGAPTYTRLLGGRGVQSEVLHAVEGNRDATLVGDLASGEGIPADFADCFILTQTLPFIADCRAALASVHRTLRPGGVVLATVPGISQISRYDMDRWGDYWRFTTRSAEMLFGEVFGAENVEVVSYGNVLAAAAFLYGLASDELPRERLDSRDGDYQLLIGVRAVKPGGGA